MCQNTAAEFPQPQNRHHLERQEWLVAASFTLHLQEIYHFPQLCMLPPERLAHLRPDAFIIKEHSNLASKMPLQALGALINPVRNLVNPTQPRHPGSLGQRSAATGQLLLDLFAMSFLIIVSRLGQAIAGLPAFHRMHMVQHQGGLRFKGLLGR